MRAVEIARKLAALGQEAEARQAYALAIQTDAEPAEELEAAAYILQTGGDYKISYTTFLDLYRRGLFQEDILSLVTKVFYEPNVKLLKSRYERNCKRLARYPYLFRKDFLPFEELPIRFFPYDDHNGYIPFYRAEGRFGAFVNFDNPVISRNFFKDLEKPVLASDVYSQYELEYLCDNVRRSEDVARENHVYLHYTDWGTFCSYLQCLSLRPLLETKKLVFLVEDEIAQYPIDFKERFGIDYSQFPVKPIGIREINRLIWHTQLSTHNGGDFFNEVFDAHPNLIGMQSIMMSSITDIIGKAREAMESVGSLREARECIANWPTYLLEELYHMRDRTDKDYFVALFLNMDEALCGLDPNARIAPAVFFQPHFHNIFKYIKTFTPMRRFTTSHGATVRFMFKSAQEVPEEGEKQNVVSDAVTERVLNRSFMVDPEDRLYKDSVVVRFEDGKLNPDATFRALAAFLDLPYTESMTYCSENGVKRTGQTAEGGYAVGFDPVTVYRTYDDFINDSERCFIEYFLRDAYEHYGYDFQYYDGTPVDEERVTEWIKGFSTIDHYMRETWIKLFQRTKVSQDGKPADADLEDKVQRALLDDYMRRYEKNRQENAKILLEGLRFVNKNGQPLRMMPRLELDPALLEQPLYH